MGNVKKREPKRGTFIEAHTASAAAVTSVSSNANTDKKPMGSIFQFGLEGNLQ